jgi:hypothetical protein
MPRYLRLNHKYLSGYKRNAAASKIQRLFRKRRSYYKPKLAKRVRNLEKNVEYKRVVSADFVSLVGVPATQIGTGVGFPIIARGDKQGQREGSRVTLKKVRISCKLTATTVTGPANKCRVILYKLSQRITTQNDMENILWGLTPIAQTTNCLLHPYRKNGDVKYQILYDKIHSMGQQLNTVDTPSKYFEIHHKCDTVLKWDQDDPNTDTVPPQMNAYVLCFQAESAPAGDEMIANWNIASTYADS